MDPAAVAPDRAFVANPLDAGGGLSHIEGMLDAAPGPLWRRPLAQGILFAALLWMVAFACYISPDVATGSARRSTVYFLALCAFVGFFLSVCVFLALRVIRAVRLSLAIPIGSAVVLGALVLHAAFDSLSFAAIVRARIVLGPQAHVSGEELLFLNNMLLLAPAHVTFAVTILLGFSLQAIGQRERRLAAALAAAQEAQLAALRFQINPHFLFNSLNALTALIASGRNADAEAVVARLAAFFRASLEREPTALVMLSEEFDMLASYLDIEAVRLGERLQVEMDLPRDLSRALVPHFLLQPLAENAVKHAVAPSTRPVTLRVCARREGTHLVLDVQDDGAGESGATKGVGVGLRNVEARLNTVYGEEAGLAIWRDPAGFIARIRLPLSLHDRRAAA